MSVGNETVLSLTGYDRRATVGGLEAEEWYVVRMSSGNQLGEGVPIWSAPVLSHSEGKSPCWLKNSCVNSNIVHLGSDGSLTVWLFASAGALVSQLHA